MNIISLIAEYLRWIFVNAATGLQTFLELNFHVVACIITLTQSVASEIQKIVFPVLDITLCYLNDFVVFSNEFVIGIHFIVNFICSILLRIVYQIHYYLSCFVNFLNIVYINLLTVINDSISCIFELYENIKFFLKLICDAILLILQLGPNLIIFLYEAFLLSLKCIWLFMCSSTCSFYSNLHTFCVECQIILFNVPPKTYFGIIMCITLFYSYKLFGQFLLSYFLLLFAFVKYLSQKLWNFAHATFYLLSGPLIIIFSKIFKSDTSIILNEEISELYDESNTNSRNFQYPTHNKIGKFFNCFKSLWQRNIVTVEEQIENLRKELSAEKEKHLCIVCHDSERNTILFPCRHMCLCDDCSRTIDSSFRRCPLCRMHIHNVLHVYT